MGEKQFVRPHGIYIGSDDSIYCTGDVDQTVRKFSTDGRLLMQLGVSGKASDTGAIPSIGAASSVRVRHSICPPNVAVAPDGTLLVSDGYGNARVHRFSADGKLLHSWGSPGSEPGQFNTVQWIAVDSTGRVMWPIERIVGSKSSIPQESFWRSGRTLPQPNEVFVDPQDNVFVVEWVGKQACFPANATP